MPCRLTVSLFSVPSSNAFLPSPSRNVLFFWCWHLHSQMATSLLLRRDRTGCQRYTARRTILSIFFSVASKQLCFICSSFPLTAYNISFWHSQIYLHPGIPLTNPLAAKHHSAQPFKVLESREGKPSFLPGVWSGTLPAKTHEFIWK